MSETTNPTSKVIEAYRKQQGLTYRSFSDALCASLVNAHISHASIMNWEKGINEPSTDFLLQCLVTYDDWRVEWAIECLCAKLPEVFDLAIDRRLIVLSNRVVSTSSLHPVV